MTTVTQAGVETAIEKVLFRKHVGDSYRVTDIEGVIPDFIRGTWYMNGPACFERGGQRYNNWLDGDGMVCALRFDSDGLQFTNRFVETRKHSEETAADRFIYRTFGTAFRGDELKRGVITESTANVSVIHFAGSLLAFGEQSIPIELDPDTLETIGPYDFAGAVNEVTPFSAHPKVDAVTGELLNFGISFSSRNPRLNYYRFDRQGKLLHRSSHKLTAPCSLHDFAVSKRYVSFYLSPYSLDAAQMATGNSATLDALRWNRDEHTTLLVLDRKTGEHVASLKMPTAYSLHTINSFERDGLLVIDLIELKAPVYSEYQIPELFRSPPAGTAVRYEVDLASNSIRSRQEIAFVGTPDFPCINGSNEMRDYQRGWMLGIEPGTLGTPQFFNQLIGFRWTSSSPTIYTSPSECLLAGEPVVVDAPAGQSDVLLCQEYDMNSDSMSVVLFNADDFLSGPVARVHLKTPVHFGFHTTFVTDGAYPDGDKEAN